RQIVELDPDDAIAQYLSAILSGQDAAKMPSLHAPVPAPFFLMEDFVSQREHEEIVALASSYREEIEHSKTGESRYRPDIRHSWQLYPDKVDELLPWFTARIRSRLTEIARRLCIPSFRPGRIEIEMTLHAPGGFYRVHQDDTGEALRSRRMS